MTNNKDTKGQVSQLFYEAAKKTWKNRKGKLGEILFPFDNFSGIRSIDVGNLPKGILMSTSFDGVGTKIEVAERVNDYSTIAYDLFAMICDDAVVRGAEPVLVGSILDVNTLEKNGKLYEKEIKQLLKGYVAAANVANVAIINGETAELGNRIGGYGKFNCNWGAAVIWFAQKDRILTGKEIKAGDRVISLKENGFRSNGLTLVRKIMSAIHGESWHKRRYQGKNLAEQMLFPSRIYCAAAVDMFGGFKGTPKAEVHGIAHITGGGIPEKLGRVLKPSGLGATLDDLFEPTKLMLYCQEKGKVPDSKAYQTWNMGQGMLIISPDPDAILMVAKDHNIEAKVSGRITGNKGIRIANQGYYNKKEFLLFE